MNSKVSLNDLIGLVGSQADLLSKEAGKMTKAFTRFESIEVS